MTHQRAIEAGARALCRLLFNHGDLDKVSSPKTRTLLEKEAEALFASLAAEGLVVVPAEPTREMHAAWMCDHRDWPARYRAMITAAQQEQNLPAPPKTGGE